jgi:ribonuclease Z
MGYVFTEPPRPEPLTEEGHIDPITRNHAALVSAGHRNPRALLGKLLNTREPIQLPDGTTLYPPPLSIPGRKIVVLGDTSDSSGMMGLAEDPSVLVHEATNAYAPGNGAERTAIEDMSEAEKRQVKEKAISRGHSTADMAGEFARKIRARRLFLNHFSAKYVVPWADS